MATRRALTVALLTCTAAWAPASARAQLTIEPHDPRFWAGGAALVVIGAETLDERLHAAAAASQTHALDRAALAVDPLGRAHYLLPALAGAVVLPRLVGHRALSDAAFRVAAGYLAADALESVVKPLVGRHRPDSTGDAWHFRPLGRGGQWGSFPSAHTTHAFAIAAGLSEEAHRPWVSALCYATATAVGAQRVYLGAHWTSDVVGGAVLSIAASKTTVTWLQRRMSRPDHDVRVGVGPDGAAMTISF